MEMDFNDSKDGLLFYLKANLARNLWVTNEFFKLWSRKDPTFIKALELMQNDAEYNRYLNLSREKKEVKTTKK